MLRSTSTTQGVIALCSGESEFHALVKETSVGFGAVSTVKDLGVDISKNTKIDRAVLEVRLDASAGRGIAVRRGAGRIRHIATPTLQVQKLTQDGIVQAIFIGAVSCAFRCCRFPQVTCGSVCCGEFSATWFIVQWCALIYL